MSKSSVLALNFSVCMQHWLVAAILIEHGADVHTQDYEGNSPLMSACLHGEASIAGARNDGGDELSCVKLLLSHGADPNARDLRKQTALIHLVDGSRRRATSRMLGDSNMLFGSPSGFGDVLVVHRASFLTLRLSTELLGQSYHQYLKPL